MKCWQQNTLMTPWSLLGVKSMPFAINTALVQWPSIGRSWSVVISARGVWHSRTAEEIKKHVMITMRTIVSSQVPLSSEYTIHSYIRCCYLWTYAQNVDDGGTSRLQKPRYRFHCKNTTKNRWDNFNGPTALFKWFIGSNGAATWKQRQVRF